MPPIWVRRVLIAPVAFVLLVTLLGTTPVWFLIAAVASPFGTGRLRPLRVLWVIAVYLALEATALVVLFALWIASGFGLAMGRPAFQRVHYHLVGVFLGVLYRQAKAALRLRIDVEGDDPDMAAPGRPELIFCRHAGPGDSFIVTHALVNWYDREPRIVLKETLQWDPAIDIVLNRLPNRFLSKRSTHPDAMSAEEHIARLATGLDSDDVLLIFPEGGNFTPKRRTRAIERLRKLGLPQWARRAERLTNVLAPQPGGVLAALEAAPEAGVVLVGHTGFEDLDSFLDVWRGLPLDRHLTMRWWSVPPGDVPADREARIAWLYDWWAKIDVWITEQSGREREARPQGR
jgi:1-acyl-sn-glycerol-3-phosphate acyltransferase